MLVQARAGSSSSHCPTAAGFIPHLLFGSRIVTTTATTSGNARAACYAGLLAFACALAALLLDLPILVFAVLLVGLAAGLLAVVGWIDVARSGGQLRGTAQALAGFVASILGLVLSVGMAGG